jgi:adenosylhomocysteine nucleosidase
MKIGILGAMPQEIALLRPELRNSRAQLRGMREYLQGSLYGKDVVLVFSRCAKVAAASTVTTLIEVFAVDLVVFTGVAGAADPGLEIGDVVIGTSLVQHDLDARPLFPRFEVPLLGRISFATPPALVALASRAAQAYLHNQLGRDVSAEMLSAFAIRSAPRVHSGLIVSGDQFVANPATLLALQDALHEAGLPPALCIEMEGAAVAQVCHEHGVPVIVMRAISDKADHSAAAAFAPFIDNIASHITCGIVRELIAQI